MALGGEDQNISFWCEKARALRWEKRREEEKRIRERKKKKSRFGTCMELYGNYLCMKFMFGNFLCDFWNSCLEMLV